MSLLFIIYAPPSRLYAVPIFIQINNKCRSHKNHLINLLLDMWGGTEISHASFPALLFLKLTITNTFVIVVSGG